MGRKKVAPRFALAVCLALAGLAVLMGLLARGREQVYAAPPQSVGRSVSVHPMPPYDYDSAIVRSPSAPLAPTQNVTLTIGKKASTAVAGAPFTYTLTVTNTGTATAAAWRR